MESLVAFVSSSLDAAMPPPAALGQEYYQDTTLELHCFTEDNASFCPVSDIRGRVRPIRRPSTFRGRQPVRQKLDQQSLLAASRIMMRKNQQWLNSKEDLTTLDTADLEPSQGLTDATSSALVEINGMEGKGIDRHTGTLLDTIPDEAPATMTRAPSLAVLDDSSSIVSNATSLVWEPMSNPLLHDLMMDNDVNSLLSNSTAGASTSSGTLTPDNTLSHGSSLETLTTPPPLQHLNSTPSFTIHRGDSVEGVFLSSDVPPPVAEELPISPSDSHQSPFRRQVFTSLMTRQSALVSRINQQSSNLLKTMQEVAEATVGPPSNGNITVQKSSTCESEKHRRTKVIFRGGIDSGEEDDALSFSTAAVDVAPHAQAIQVPVVKRVGERMLSICDSGLGWDTDDDLRTSSLGSFSTLSSTSTLSEDSENVPEDEAGKASPDHDGDFLTPFTLDL
ncbi:hypothetical protein Pmani_025296 [Petrolisthes manimaculis]|uniref:Uncharacterized protein n=1 Tax=Petrolisthes manimaculis TaxID=1843537 RepID=A0AAE1P5T5_9EUCA|nr:hypothetical protein Pmani_025296 [Petrolisthes manimaculis]